MALKGIKVVEMAGLAPVPFCGMILSDFGASVLRVDRVAKSNMDRMTRGKRSIAVDLKCPKGVEIVSKLCHKADVLIEPFRPGVMEKLGLGPSELMRVNPRLVYARLTGFGQTGPLKDMAGHDINYVALSGILSVLGRKEQNPVPPINLLADFAGGGLTCALGILLALFDRTTSGRGQVIDCSMVEGAAYVSSFVFGNRDFLFNAPRGENLLDSGSYFYDVYKTKDGKYMSVGALEPQFYSLFVKGLSFSREEMPQSLSDFSEEKVKIAARFAEKTQAEWSEIFKGSDACVLPVLTTDEAFQHPHNKERGTFLRNASGNYEPIPAPRLSATPGVAQIENDLQIGQHTKEVLLEEGYDQTEILNLEKEGVIEICNVSSKL